MKASALLLLLFIQLFARMDAAPIADVDVHFDVSAAGDAVLYFDKTRACFWLYKGEKYVRTIEPVGASNIRDVPLHVSGSLSNDGSFVLVSFNTGESSRVAQIFSVVTGDLVFEYAAANAIWEKGRNVALFVPDYGVAEEQGTSGLLSYDVSSGKIEELFKSYYFTGQIAVGEQYVIANVLAKDSETAEFKTIIGSLSNGSVTVIGQ